jgi:tetratricopeptide (TPR) repeat protein
MKRLFALIALLLAGTLGVAAQSIENQYVQIYNLIQLADAYQNANQPAQALPRYLEAQSALQRLQRLNPEWNPRVVTFRLNYLADKIAAFPGTKPATNAIVAKPPTAPPAASAAPATKPVTPPTPTTPPPAAETKAAPSAELQQQMAALQSDVNRLQTEKVILEAKLKEALATQPAAIDPRELAKAQERVQSLLKENELLKTSLNEEKNRPVPAANPKELEELKQALAESNRKLADQSARVTALLAQQENARTNPPPPAPGVDVPTELAATRLAMTEANRRLAEQRSVASQLAAEKSTLEQRVKELTDAAAQTETLRTENELLKKQLADATAGVAAQVETETRRATAAETRVASLQAEAQVLTLEKAALEGRLSQSAGVRDQASQLTATNRELAAKVDQLTREASGLRARLEAVEASAIPYSTEELALLQTSPPQFTASYAKPDRAVTPELPAATVALAAEAQQRFAAKDYPKAEANYLEIVKQDDQNPKALANLATIQMEMGHLDQAEKQLQQALTVAPNDAATLLLLGNLKYRQEKYDEALTALSRAAKINPQSSEIQNLLGVTLSHKGLRGPAETALRRALQIDPALGSAHHNLAVIYATQTPPLLELARWHYQKALASGHAKNEELEKLFARKEPVTR